MHGIPVESDVVVTPWAFQGLHLRPQIPPLPVSSSQFLFTPLFPSMIAMDRERTHYTGYKDSFTEEIQMECLSAGSGLGSASSRDVDGMRFLRSLAPRFCID
jgi:hypothetical protein